MEMEFSYYTDCIFFSRNFSVKTKLFAVVYYILFVFLLIFKADIDINEAVEPVILEDENEDQDQVNIRYDP